MKRLFSLFLVILTLFTLSVPAFATEVSEPSEGSGTVTLDGATVNVSPDSIQAIADAVTGSDPETVALVFSDNKTYSVPYLDGYDYVLFSVASPSRIYCMFSKDPITLERYSGNTSNGYRWKVTINGCFYDTASKVWEDYNGQVPYIIDGNTVPYYSTHEIMQPSGFRAEYSSTWREPYVNFQVNPYPEIFVEYFEARGETFDPSTLPRVESCLASEFVLPEISYPGFSFDGWYLDLDFTLPYTSGYVFRNDTVLYAKWSIPINISFVTGIDGFTLDTIQAGKGEVFALPTFSYPGYEYYGLYYDEAFERPFVEGTILEEDTTFYLRFEAIEYDVGALVAETNTLLTAILFLMCIWSAVYVFTRLIGR